MIPEFQVPGVHVDPVENPLPNSSFGDVGCVVHVRFDIEELGGRVPSVLLGVAPQDLGYVDASTLRLFEYVSEDQDWKIVEQSVVDLESLQVEARIERPGVYALFGLPADRRLRRSLDLYLRLSAEYPEIDPGSAFCEIAFCAGPFADAWADTTFPAGVGMDACALCHGLKKALPEGKIKSRRAGIDPPIPVLYALIDDPNLTGIHEPGPALHALDLKTNQEIGIFTVGGQVASWGSAVMKVVASTYQVLVLDGLRTTGQRLIIFDRDAAGHLRNRRYVALGAGAYDLVFDGVHHRAYVTLEATAGPHPAWGSIVAIDTISNQIVDRGWPFKPIPMTPSPLSGLLALGYREAPQGMGPLALSYDGSEVYTATETGGEYWALPANNLDAMPLRYGIVTGRAFTNLIFAIDTGGGRLCSWDQIDELAVLDLPSLAVSDVVRLGHHYPSILRYPQIAFDEATKQFFVWRVDTWTSAGEVIAYSIPNRTSRSVPLPGKWPVTPLAFGGQIYVIADSTLLRIDPTTLQVSPALYTYSYPNITSSAAVSALP